MSDRGRGSGGELTAASQLQTDHQVLLRGARDRLRGCQESQAFGESLQGLWTWLEEIQERLGTVDSTMGSKDQLETRLEAVQVSGGGHWMGRGRMQECICTRTHPHTL